MSGNEAFLELRAVHKHYPGSEGGPPLPILRDVHLRIGRGDTLAIIGASGSGKTTLLNLLGTLDRPDSGELTLDGQDLARLDDEALARVRNRSIGFVFQFHYLLPHLSAIENVILPTLATNRPARIPDELTAAFDAENA